MCEGTEGHRSACVASVLRPLALYFFFAFFTLFLFFCGRVGRIAAGAAGTRLDCHLTVLWQPPRVLGAALAADALSKVVVWGARGRDNLLKS